MILLYQFIHPEEDPLYLASSLDKLSYAKGENASLLLDLLREEKEGYALQISNLSKEDFPSCYLKGETDLASLQAKIEDILDLGPGICFLDLRDLAQEDLETLLPKLEETFHFDSLLLFLPNLNQGELQILPELPKEHGFKETAYEESYPLLFDDILGIERKGEQPNKVYAPRAKKARPEEPKAEETPKPKKEKKAKASKQEAPTQEEKPSPLSNKEKKNLLINLGFACFYPLLAFLLPIILHSADEEPSESLSVISIVLAYLFAFLSILPIYLGHKDSRGSQAKKKARLLLMLIPSCFDLALSIGCLLLILLVPYPSLTYAFLGALGLAVVSPIVLIPILNKLDKKEANP